MLSIDYELSTPEYPLEEIGYGALVRVHNANFQLQITNDGEAPAGKLNVQPVLESYVGQDKPKLFLQLHAQVIENIPPKSMIVLDFILRAHYPGLVAVANYVTDTDIKAVMVKRKTELTYHETPVRYWFYVLDNIAVETLMVLRQLAVQWPKDGNK